MNSLQFVGAVILVLFCFLLFALWGMAMRKNRDLDQENDRLCDSISTLHGTIVGMRRDHTRVMQEKNRLLTERDQLLAVNDQNAKVHRRDQVAAHYQNLALQAAQAHLAGRPVDPELAGAAHSAGFMHLQRPLSEPATATSSPSP